VTDAIENLAAAVRAGDRRALARAVTLVESTRADHREDELHALMPHKPPPDLSRFLLSPMPGLLVSLAVGAGQEVKEGEPLAVVEAMKMENSLLAPRDAVVAKVLAAKGDSLAVDQPILEFKQ